MNSSKGMLCAVALAVAPVFLLLSPSTPALADYIATGPFEGEECTSYVVFDRCKTHSVDAVEGDDGRLYTLQERYEDVSKHWVRKNGTQMCRIDVKAQRRTGLWDNVANLLLARPTFYTRTSDGRHEEVDVEYLMFKCRETK